LSYDEEDEDVVFEHARLGRLEYDGAAWEGSTLELGRFTLCGWNKKHVGEHLWPSYDDDFKRIKPPEGERFGPSAAAPAGWGKRPVKVTIETEDGERPTRIQDQVLAWLIDDQEQIARRIGLAAEEYVRDATRHGYWKWITETLQGDLPRLEELLGRPMGWRSLIEIREVRISDKTRGEDVVVGFDCNCAWDGEHGFGVQLTKDLLVDVGEGTVGWNIYEEPEFIEHPRLGKLEGSIPFWRCRSELPHQFISCGWNTGSVYARLAEARDNRSQLPKSPPPLDLTQAPPKERVWPLEIVFHSNQESGPTEAQFQAIEHLLDHQQPLLVEIAKGHKKYATRLGVPQEMEKLLGAAYGDLEKLLKTVAGWLSLLSFNEIRVTEAVREGSIVIGCACTCGWPFDFYRDTSKSFADLGVLLSEKGVLQVGPQSIIYKL
jgi:hypothetical protein